MSSKAAPPDHMQEFPDGAAVEYYSSSHGGWVPAKVQGFNVEKNYYELDIQPMAFLNKVRAPTAQTPFAQGHEGTHEGGGKRRTVQPHAQVTSDKGAQNLLMPSQDAAQAERPAAPHKMVRPCDQCKCGFPPSDLLTTPCQHVFCTPCMQGHVLNLDYLRVRVGCPQCRIAIPTLMVRQIVGDRVFAEGQAKMEREDEELARRMHEDLEAERQVAAPAQAHRVPDLSPGQRAPDDLRRNPEPRPKQRAREDNRANAVATNPFAGFFVRDGKEVKEPRTPARPQGDNKEPRRHERTPAAIPAPPREVVGGVPCPTIEESTWRPCGLCDARLPVEQLLGPDCEHAFCPPCIEEHVLRNDFVREPVLCPVKGCTTALTSLQVQHAVGKKAYADRRIAADEEAVRALQQEFEREERSADAKRHVFQCPVCLFDGSLDEAIEFDCSHKLCSTCFSSYLESKIMEAQVSAEELVCPIPGCKTEITVAQVQGATADGPLWEKFLYFRMNQWVPESGERIIECPTPDCSKFVVPRDQDFVQCPVCKKEWCSKCGGDKHDKVTCEEYKRWKGDNENADQNFEALMAEQMWRRCPHCGMPSERESGCNFMQCRSPICQKKRYWCYVCGLKLAKEDHYSHYQRGPYEDECKTPLDKRIELKRPVGAVVTPAADEEGVLGVLRGWLGGVGVPLAG